MQTSTLRGASCSTPMVFRGLSGATHRTISHIAWVAICACILLMPGLDVIALDQSTEGALARQTNIQVDEFSDTIEIEPLSSYYFAIEDNEIKTIQKAKLPVLDALKRVPNWLRPDLEAAFEKLMYADVAVDERAAPVLYDIDGDLDLDLIIGTEDGKLYSYTNDDGLWLRGSYLKDSTGRDIDVGHYAVPTFVRLREDWDVYMVLGAANGQLYLYENTAAGWRYAGRLTDVDDNPIDVGSYSAPAFAYIIDSGSESPPVDWIDLVVGAEDGMLYLYEDTGTNTTTLWTYRGRLFAGLLPIDVGSYSKPAFADLDNDGDMDLTVGAEDGDLSYYENTGENEWTEDGSVYQDISVPSHAAPALADMDMCYIAKMPTRIDLVVGTGQGTVWGYKNVGTVTKPRWTVWPSYNALLAYNYYRLDYKLKYRALGALDNFTELLIDVEQKYVDEIAFCLAHTSPDLLRKADADEDHLYFKLLKENARSIYEVDKYIQYADLTEHGDYTTGEYWTTVSYTYGKWTTDGTLETYTTELPRDIYYWFVVHPKITDEEPAYIDPDTGDVDEDGYFWRDYLFFHADDEYPDDPEIDNDGDGEPDWHYPKAKPPLLKDKIAGITVLYDNKPYDAPSGYNISTGYFDDPANDRTWAWSYREHPHAIEIVSNWVAKTLPLNQQEVEDDERPIQPVRIARHHNGNCGELQDLTVAAARTCLIPAAGVCLIAEDHVWSEFYCYDEARDEQWHQWDNYWSDSGSVIDRFDNYWVGWDKRGGSGIFKWWGDDHITDVTGNYIISASGAPEYSPVKVNVYDADGRPVDGARVSMKSHWFAEGVEESITGMSFHFTTYIPELGIPGIWGYTDSNGISEFKLAANSFDIDVVSKLGSTGTTIPVEIGEKGEGSQRIDYGWIEDEDGDVVWRMGHGDHAGGDIRNREDRGWLALDAGTYTVHYVTDGTHAYDSWVDEPPDSGWGDFFNVYWGIGVFNVAGSITEILSITDVGNNAEVTRQFTLSAASDDIYVYCMGEWAYKFVFRLEDTQPQPLLRSPGGEPPTTPDYTMELEYEVLYGEQHPRNLYVGNSHPERVNAHIDVFICDSQNFKDYISGNSFYLDETTIGKNTSSNELTHPIDDGWYLVFSNYDAVETKKTINITIRLKRTVYTGISVTITSVDECGLINGIASSVFGARTVWVRVDNGEWMRANGTDTWSYNISLIRYYPGQHTIYARVSDGVSIAMAKLTAIFAIVTVELDISTPAEDAVVGGVIEIAGQARYPHGQIRGIEVKLGDTEWASARGTTLWSVDIDTRTVEDGEQTIYVRALDGGIYSYATMHVIVDNTPPTINIVTPQDGEKVSGIITVQGNAVDTIGVEMTTIKIDDGEWSYSYTKQISSYMVEGYVYDTSGHCIENALVTLIAPDFFKHTYTDSSGYYEARTPKGEYTMTIGKPGYVPYEANATIDGGKVLNITLRPYHKIYGFVYNPTGAPVSDAIVYVTPQRTAAQNYFEHTYTSTSGYYEIAVDAGTYRLVIGKPGYIRYQTQIDVDAYKEVNATLKSKVYGYIRDDIATPIEGAIVLAIAGDYFNITYTNASGYYELNVHRWEFTVFACKRGHSTYSEDIHERDPVERNITLTTTEEIENIKLYGRVTNETGITSLAGVTICAFSDTYSNFTHTDASGMYELDVPTGRYTIVMFRTGYTPNWTKLIVDSDTEFDANLTRVEPIYSHGLISNDMNGQGIAGAVITFDIDNKFNNYFAFVCTDEMGQYQIELPKVKRSFYRVVGRAGYAPWSKWVSVSQTDVANVKLQPAHKVYGRVTTGSTKNGRAALSDVLVCAVNEHHFAYTYTDPEGYYVIDAPEDEFLFLAGAAGYKSHQDELTVTVAEKRDIQLEPQGTAFENIRVSGYLRNHRDQTMSNAIVWFVSQSYYQSTYTDETGRYDVELFVDGFDDTFQIGAGATEGNYAPYVEARVIAASEQVDAQMGAALYRDEIIRVYGHVYDSTGRGPIANASITVWADDYFNSTYANETGYYLLMVPKSRSPNDIFTVTIGHQGHEPYSTALTIDISTELDVTLSPAATVNERMWVYGYVSTAPGGATTRGYVEEVAVLVSSSNYFNLTYTNKFGYYQMNVPEGIFTMLIGKHDYVPYRYTLELSGAIELNLSIGPLHAIYGYTYNDTSVPVKDVLVLAASDQELAFTYTDASGYYELGIPADDYTFIAGKMGHTPYRAEMTVKLAERLDLTFVLRKLYGHVYANGQTPLKDTLVCVISETRFSSVYTDEDGYYDLTVPEDKFTIYFGKSGYAPYSVEMSIGGLKELEVVLDASPSMTRDVNISGRLYDPTHKPLDNASLFMLSKNYFGIANTDAMGYHESYIPLGLYSFLISKQGYVAYFDHGASEKVASWSFELNTTGLTEGRHTIYIRAYDGRNHPTRSMTFIVNNNAPPEMLYSPRSNPSIVENASQTFRIMNAFDPDARASALSYRWFLDGAELVELRNQTHYTFVSDYETCDLTRPTCTFRVTATASDGIESTSHSWVLTVTGVNRPPSITAFTPRSSELTIDETATQAFTVTGTDEDSENITISWLVNGEQVASGSRYTFTASYIGSLSSLNSPFEIAVVVSDGSETARHVWSLVVDDVNRAPVAEPSPAVGEIELTLGEFEGFSVLNISDADDDGLTIIWRLNNAIIEGERDADYTFVPTTTGRYTVSIVVSDGKTAISSEWVVTVKEAGEPDQVPGVLKWILGPEGLLLLSALVVIVILLLIVVIIARKKTPPMKSK